MRRAPVIAVASIAVVALAVPWLPLDNPLHIEVANRLATPSPGHWLGQDEYGRDVLSRLLWGARTSLVVAGASASLACLCGIVLGLLGGYLRGVVEFVTIRSMDVDLATGLRMEQLMLRHLQSTEDVQEGTAAFAQKRPPRFTGR